MKKTENSWRKIVFILLLSLWVFASVVAAQFVVGGLMIMIFGSEKMEQPVFVAIYSALSYVIAMLLIILVPRKKLQTSRKELGLFQLPTWTDIGLAPVGFIVATLLAAGATAIFSIFPWFDAAEVQDTGFSMYMSGGDRIIAFITLVVIAPIAEEIIFRGWLYGKVRGELNGKMPEWAGILISALAVSILFGVVHLQWNVGINVFCLSLVLCALREVTGTIYAGILTHMIKNGVAFYLLYVLGM